ncbi:MAG: hypothetical protein J7L90_02525 [Dehalococcoidia bacterium]|nr:hypothetical protein [Dehalococcoidia bacterium]
MKKSLFLNKSWLTVITCVREFFTFEESAQGKRKRKEVLVLAGVFCALVISAIIVGVSDNIPGIVLCYLAAVVLAVAATRTWRKTRRFLILVAASVVGFFVFVFLHNAFYALTMLTNHIAALSHLMEAFHVVFFIIAVFLCPATFLVGGVGSIVYAIIERRKRSAR